MFWVMRQPTCVFVETVQIAEMSGDHGLRSSPHPGHGTSAIILDPSVRRSCPRPACPAAGTIGAVPFRVAVTRRARRNTFQVFKANEKANDATQAKCKHVDRATAHRPRVPGARARTSISRLGVSTFTLATARDRRAGSKLERRNAATRARPRAVCGVHRTTPPPGPGPGDPIRDRRPTRAVP